MTKPGEEIARAVRQRRIVGAEAARLMLEQAIAGEDARAAATAARQPQAGQPDEYDVLFADPATVAARRVAAAGQRAATVAALTDAELHEQLFGSSAFRDTGSAYAAGPPGHVEFVGQHVHEHPAYDGAGGRHSHPHAHTGDANHGPGDFHPHSG